MKTMLSFSLVIMGLLAFSPDDAWGQKKDNAKKSDLAPATPQQYTLLATYKEMVGKIQSADTKTGQMTLRVEYSPPGGGKDNDNKKNNNNVTPAQIQKEIARLQQDYAKLNSTKNPAQKQQLQQKIQQEKKKLQNDLQHVQATQGNPAQQQLVQALQKKGGGQKDYIDFELTLQENAPLRKMNIGVEYDNKGNVIEKTPAYLAELKGKNTALPGYSAKDDDLVPGTVVKVFLGPPGKAGAKAEATAKVAIGVNPPVADVKANVAAGNHPSVKMIVILAEPNGPVKNGKMK